MNRFALAAASLVLSTLAASAQGAAPADSDHKILPPGPGRDLMIATCSKCHSPDIVADHPQDAAGWKDTIAEMVNNGAQASDAEFAQIADYLAKSFPAGQ